jgi:hypothetical protein
MSTPTGATGATGPTDPNQSTSQLTGALRQALIDLAVKQFMTWFAGQLPTWLPGWALSIVNPLLGWVVAPLVGWITGKLIDLTILGVNEAWIKISTDANVQAVQDAAQTLQNLPPDATPEQIAAAQQAFNDAAGNLITIHDAPIPQP